MKIVASSDWHPDHVTAGFPRFDDVRKAAKQSVARAIAIGAKLYLFTGDLCDPDRGRAHEAGALLIDCALELRREGIATRAIPGNHDVLEDGTGTSTLEPLAALEAIEAITGVGEDGTIRVAKTAEFESVGDWPFDLLALPYVARSHAYDPVVSVAIAKEEREKSGRSDRPIIVYGHLMLEGIEQGSESAEMARGRDLFFPIGEVLAAFGDKAIMLNGHYHKRQKHRGVQVVGSLERLTFGEEGTKPGWLELEVGK
jgi:DNA repair exonuclease SbcCD nuclease subunit